MHTVLNCGGWTSICCRLRLNLSFGSMKFLISAGLEAGYHTSEHWIKDMIPIYSMLPLDIGLIIYLTVKFCSCTPIPRIYNPFPWKMITLSEYKLAALARSYHYLKWAQRHSSWKITEKCSFTFFAPCIIKLFEFHLCGKTPCTITIT